MSVYCFPPKRMKKFVTTFADFLPHNNTRREPHDEQVTVQDSHKSHPDSRRSEHQQCIPPSRDTQETHTDHQSARSTDHRFKQQQNSYQTSDPKEVSSEKLDSIAANQRL